MNPGTMVRLTTDPGRRGITTKKSRARGGRLFWLVAFLDGSQQYISEKQLETVSTEMEDALDLFKQGKFGRARDLRGAITHIRLSGRLADLIYSMETTNTDFYSYQFKPVLNFLDSPSRGILIADEVGLGKTIEAGLIWTELRSRYDTRRLMVLCPAMLREKWKLELQRRFGINVSIVDTSETLQTLKEYRAGNLSEFAIVASMQGLRPNRGWEDDESLANKTSVKLAQFLSENAHDEPLIDLLIVDEAHYLRNPQSMTSRLGRLLRNVADHIVLLSATPIHLKNMDLYNLLNLVDEDSFNQIHVFDDILQANAPLIHARDMILRGKADVQEFIGQLEDAKSHMLLSNNRQLQTILDNPPNTGDLQNNAYRSELAHRLEGINLLGSAVTRTRKREVTEWMVTREAKRLVVELSSVEAEFYARVTDLVRQYCLERGAHEGFLLVTPQRQISSSMPAALREWQRRKFKLEQIYEDFGEDPENIEEIGPLVQEILDNAHDLGDLQELWDNDSKYKSLSIALKQYLKDHPTEKVVIFAYFRPTLYYLNERLALDGIESLVLVGGGKVDKNEEIERFKSPKGPSVLLASEVASEGVDLQFSRVVVNYDLPWNPMKVEQRIGRIDRIGQSSPKIIIWNFFYDNTIDARIYNRLYERLDIFTKALGGLEAILGEEIKKMTIDLLKEVLSPEQEEERIRQTEQAVSNLRDEEERLELNASNLIAHGDYILNQVKAARELGRWITGEDLWIYIRDFFKTKYPGCEFRQLKHDDLIFDIKLSDDARFDFERFIQSRRLTGQTRLTQAASKSVRCQFKNQVSQQKLVGNEHINQFHPLPRFVSEMIKESIEDSEIMHFPSVSLRLNKKEVPVLDPKDYLFYVEHWTIQGLKDIERMVYIARASSENSKFLNEEEAEQLVTTAAKYGIDWLSAANEVNIDMLIPLVDECIEAAENKHSDYISFLENENNDRADLQEKTLNLHMERQREKLKGVLRMHEEKGNIKMLAPTRGQIEKMETRVRDKMREIENRRKLQYPPGKEVCLVIIRLE
jgi:superfamily II DNA or RNA helicase